MSKEIDKMSREELIRLINSINIERDVIINHINKVSVCDVEVASSIESLESCKCVVNDLIKTNSKFITSRNDKIKADNLGYFG